MKYNRKWQHLYNTRRWIRGRLIHLNLKPLCVYCLQVGVTTPATVVDHIKPHMGDEELFFDTGNWQSLCTHCHDSVKAREESRGCSVGHDVNGMPVGNHPWNK